MGGSSVRSPQLKHDLDPTTRDIRTPPPHGCVNGVIKVKEAGQVDPLGFAVGQEMSLVLFSVLIPC